MVDLRQKGVSEGGEQPPQEEKKADIAGFWRRLLAFLIDLLLLVCFGAGLGFAFFNQLAAMGQAGRLIGAAATLLYCGILNSKWGGGATLGKRALGLKVIRRDGRPIGLARSFLRTIVFWTPWYLNNLNVSWPGVNSTVLVAIAAVCVVIVFGGSLLIAYLYVFNRRTRQSLHDLVAGTFVVRAEPENAPVASRIWKGHFAFAFVVFLGFGGLVFALLRLATGTIRPNMNALTAIQTAVAAKPGVDAVQVTMNTTTFRTFGQDGKTVVSTQLQVNVRMRSVPLSMEAAQNDIAKTVLDRAPSLLGEQYLLVGVSSGYDIGIFTWTTTDHWSGTLADWKKRLQSHQSTQQA